MSMSRCGSTGPAKGIFRQVTAGLDWPMEDGSGSL